MPADPAVAGSGPLEPGRALPDTGTKQDIAGVGANHSVDRSPHLSALRWLHQRCRAAAGPQGLGRWHPAHSCVHHCR